MISTDLQNIAYLVAAALFIFDLKWMSHPRTAVQGNYLGALAMAIAIFATLLGNPPQTWTYIAIGVVVGTVIGAVSAARVKMTSMPEMVGLFNGFGGGASILVAGAALVVEILHIQKATAAAAYTPSMQTLVATVASGLIGSVTFFGSYVAFGKLAEFLAVKWKLHTWQKIIKYGFSAVCVAGGAAYAFPAAILDPGKDTMQKSMGAGIFVSGLVIGLILLVKKDRFPGMDMLKWGSAAASVALGVLVVMNPTEPLLFWLLVGVSGVLGVLLTLSIGGADMPVVIALLNSYSGLAAAATGFVVSNSVLIVSGSLVGASGIILTMIMCKAMNRSLTNVLFGGVGAEVTSGPGADEVYKTVKATSAEEIAMMLDGVQRVCVVPGYGMAVAQAQHTVRTLANLLEEKGVTVDFAIHPVAGRMPGHMNVLLAEADVPYDKLREMDDINQEMEQIDVAIVLGANDVVNPVARTDPNSPIAGMPIIDVDKARTVIMIKRSLSPGFAGIPNPLFAADNCMMFFNDGKKAIQAIIQAIKEND